MAEALGKVEIVVSKQLSNIDKKLDQAAKGKADSVAGLWADAAHKEVQKRLKKSRQTKCSHLGDCRGGGSRSNDGGERTSLEYCD